MYRIVLCVRSGGFFAVPNIAEHYRWYSASGSRIGSKLGLKTNRPDS